MKRAGDGLLREFTYPSELETTRLILLSSPETRLKLIIARLTEVLFVISTCLTV